MPARGRVDDRLRGSDACRGRSDRGNAIYASLQERQGVRSIVESHRRHPRFRAECSGEPQAHRRSGHRRRGGHATIILAESESELDVRMERPRRLWAPHARAATREGRHLVRISSHLHARRGRRELFRRGIGDHVRTRSHTRERAHVFASAHLGRRVGKLDGQRPGTWWMVLERPALVQSSHVVYGPHAVPRDR